jgi:hypothetical protein
MAGAGAPPRAVPSKDEHRSRSVLFVSNELSRRTKLMNSIIVGSLCARVETEVTTDVPTTTVPESQTRH